jgi:hypothetical protein
MYVAAQRTPKKKFQIMLRETHMSTWMQWTTEGFFGASQLSMPSTNSALIEAFVSGTLLQRIVDLHVSSNCVCASAMSITLHCMFTPFTAIVHYITTAPCIPVQEAEVARKVAEQLDASYTTGVSRGRADMDLELEALKQQLSNYKAAVDRCTRDKQDMEESMKQQ